MAKIVINEENRVYVDCAIFSMGADEFGTDYTAESYFVVVERLDGHRLAHFHDFVGCIRHEDHEAGYVGFEDIREEAKAKADDLVDSILAVGSINDDHWSEFRPAYGSAYYCIMNGF